MIQTGLGILFSDELLQTFAEEVGEVALRPGTDERDQGVFRVVVDGTVVWNRAAWYSNISEAVPAGWLCVQPGRPGVWRNLSVSVPPYKSDDAVIELLGKYVKLDHPAKGAWAGGRGPFRHPCPRARAKKK